MLAAIILGALAGFVGFLPLTLGLRMTRRVTDTSNLGHMATLLLGVLGSFFLLFAAAIACIILARDLILPFTVAEVVALSVVAIGFGVSRLLRK